MDEKNKIFGIFSRKNSVTVGTGTTKSRSTVETYWFIKETAHGEVRAQSLDMDFKPQGEPFAISRESLFEDYHLEPHLSYRLLSQPLLIGDHYRATGKYAQAEQEYLKVKRIDEENIRANFGLGLLYLEMEKENKAAYIFDKLVSLDEAFELEHKHLFNEFGIALRKRGLFDEALKYYFRARELSADDDHLLLNIARVYFEGGHVPEAARYARQALAINPGLVEASRLLEALPAEAAGQGGPPVPAK